MDAKKTILIINNGENAAQKRFVIQKDNTLKPLKSNKRSGQVPA